MTTSYHWERGMKPMSIFHIKENPSAIEERYKPFLSPGPKKRLVWWRRS